MVLIQLTPPGVLAGWWEKFWMRRPICAPESNVLGDSSTRSPPGRGLSDTGCSRCTCRMPPRGHRRVQQSRVLRGQLSVGACAPPEHGSMEGTLWEVLHAAASLLPETCVSELRIALLWAQGLAPLVGEARLADCERLRKRARHATVPAPPARPRVG